MIECQVRLAFSVGRSGGLLLSACFHPTNCDIEIRTQPLYDANHPATLFIAREKRNARSFVSHIRALFLSLVMNIQSRDVVYFPNREIHEGVM